MQKARDIWELEKTTVSGWHLEIFAASCQEKSQIARAFAHGWTFDFGLFKEKDKSFYQAHLQLALNCL